MMAVICYCVKHSKGVSAIVWVILGTQPIKILQVQFESLLRFVIKTIKVSYNLIQAFKLSR